MTTVTILVAGLLWYLLHLFSTVSLGCEDLVAWWFDGGLFRPRLLYVSSLFTITLGLWLYVDIVRPKAVRIPVGIRAVQIWFVTVMVVISVLQWGFFRPQSQEGRIYAYFQDEVLGWPVMNLFFVQPYAIWAFVGDPPEEVVQGPLFDEYRTLNSAYRREFLDAGVPRRYGRAGGRYNGRLDCTARDEVDAAWERGYQAWLQAEQAEVD
ncbi:hypothetical protein [uncultured Maricaulis sp.]|uniref:hypothetical protein n=1 Tax=uncultured Maricaulis sp. TaxID=174710 RepID=UPI0030DC9B06